MRVRKVASGVALASLLSCPAQAQTNAQSGTAKPAAAPTTVVVQAKTPAVVHKIDRTVYNLQDNPLAETGSVSDILTTLPSVYVDPRGNVTVRGASAEIYIDGKPAPQFRGVNIATALQAMPANTVASIEVITNPGAEFRTTARTIINIVTRKTKAKPLSGDLIVNAGPDGRYNATLIASFGVGKWSFTGNATWGQSTYKWQQSSERDVLDAAGNATSRLLEDEVTSRHMSAPVLNGAATYTVSDADSLILSAHINAWRSELRHDDLDTYLQSATSETNTRIDGPTQGKSRFLTGTYKHKEAGDDGLTVQFTHSEYDNVDDTRYDQANLVPAAPDSLYQRGQFARGQMDNLTGDYVHTLAPDTQFKSGFDIESARNQNHVLATDTDAVSGVQTVDPSLTSRFLTDNRLLAGYVEYQTPFGKWLVQGGLRLEDELTRFTAARAAGYTEIADTELSPSLYVSHPLTADSKLKFSYSRHISRPSGDQLDAAVIQVDPQDLAVGNPALKPSREDSFEANYNYTTKPLSFDATAYFRDNQHTITPYSYYPDPGDLLMVTTYENAGRSTRGGLDMSLDLHPAKTIGFDFSTDLYTTALSAPAGLAYIRQSIASYLAKASVSWQPTSADNLQANYIVSGRSLIAEGTQSGTQTFILSYSRKLNAKWKLTASVADLFNTGESTSVMHTPQLNLFVRSVYPGQYAFVGFDYKFGSGK